MLKKLQGSPLPLGVTVKEDKVNFSVAVPAGKACTLVLYRAGEENPVYTFDMPEAADTGDVRCLALKEMIPEDFEYNYIIDGRVQIDPYVKALSGCGEFGEKWEVQSHQVRGKISWPRYNWEEDKKPAIPYHEVIAYTLHIRGFTRHKSSGVRHKGTFLGVVEKIPYLKQLGINQIQCMPIYEFIEEERGKKNYWGYGPAYFFAPKSSYASGGDGVKELKDMVRECHKSGIEVVLEMPFTPDTLPQMALECLRYYMLEYHIDGFIINPYQISWDMVTKDPLLKKEKILCQDSGFQDVMRRYLKGDEGMVEAVIWALKHNSGKDGKCNYITSHNGFTLWDLVSYDGKHNEANGERNRDGAEYNYSWNCGAEGPSRKRNVVQLRKNQAKNALFLLLTAQGTPCLLAGDEFYNSQEGNNNTYCQDNELGWVNWGKLRTDDSLFQFLKRLIALRKSHPSLHRKNSLKGMDMTACGIPDVSYHGENAWQVQNEVSSRQLGVLYNDEGTGDICFVAYNMHWLPHNFALPALTDGKKWYKVMETKEEGRQGTELLANQRVLEMKERDIAFLIGK